MHKILVVDDEPAILENFTALLTLSGYSVENAPDGLIALEKLPLVKPDLILCDVTMPHLDGYAVLAAVRFNPETARLPFIFVTGAPSSMDKSVLAAYNAQVLPKPFKIEPTLDLITALLANAD